IQNTQNRDSKALHLKMDEIIYRTKTARNRLIDLEDLPDEELDELQREFKKIQKAQQKRRKKVRKVRQMEERSKKRFRNDGYDYWFNLPIGTKMRIIIPA